MGGGGDGEVCEMSQNVNGASSALQCFADGVSGEEAEVNLVLCWQ